MKKSLRRALSVLMALALIVTGLMINPTTVSADADDDTVTYGTAYLGYCQSTWAPNLYRGSGSNSAWADATYEGTVIEGNGTYTAILTTDTMKSAESWASALKLSTGTLLNVDIVGILTALDMTYAEAVAALTISDVSFAVDGVEVEVDQDAVDFYGSGSFDDYLRIDVIDAIDLTSLGEITESISITFTISGLPTDKPSTVEEEPEVEEPEDPEEEEEVVSYGYAYLGYCQDGYVFNSYRGTATTTAWTSTSYKGTEILGNGTYTASLSWSTLYVEGSEWAEMDLSSAMLLNVDIVGILSALDMTYEEALEILSVSDVILTIDGVSVTVDQDAVVLMGDDTFEDYLRIVLISDEVTAVDLSSYSTFSNKISITFTLSGLPTDSPKTADTSCNYLVVMICCAVVLGTVVVSKKRRTA